MSGETPERSTARASRHRVEGQQCSDCTHWERHEPRDAAGFCERHGNGSAMEDEWCPDFSAAQRNMRDATDEELAAGGWKWALRLDGKLLAATVNASDAGRWLDEKTGEVVNLEHEKSKGRNDG